MKFVAGTMRSKQCSHRQFCGLPMGPNVRSLSSFCFPAIVIHTLYFFSVGQGELCQIVWAMGIYSNLLE